MSAAHDLDHLDLDHLDLLARQVDALLAEAEDVDHAAPVAACPGWDVGALLEHVGGTYRWASAMVRSGSTTRARWRDVVPAPGPDPRTWLRDSADDVLGALRASDPLAPAWTFGPGPTAGFWRRRLLHETAVHTADVALSAGRTPSTPLAVARDGVAEHLLVVPLNPGVAARAAASAPAAPLHLLVEEVERPSLPDGPVPDGPVPDGPAPDARPGGRWLVRWDADGSTVVGTGAGAGGDVTDGAAPADVVVRGRAVDLLLALWRRGDDVVVEGDADAWRRWSAAHAL
ncbi:maleylpyruvate isomerase N-terminal domain-containing protein [Pseudokineococcus marinus]|uniref:Maleylpyruvate isomerase family protein n=1 Tax=Pseudokineococcus marinus TaxID=351215 RepID=A0A849BQB9_9ACTN|nr:maleylpyruvate isomerase N-terminal domain-containing protein [Pseudokineococcus marinus]NNH23573.1 maleylpyruvate isomerase family protein [Pseudokineococcus marinus]